MCTIDSNLRNNHYKSVTNLNLHRNAEAIRLQNVNVDILKIHASLGLPHNNKAKIQ